LKTGQVDAELPVQLTVNGKTADVFLKFTTESAAGALGNVRGRRASINQAKRSAQLSMVSGTVIKDIGLIKDLLVVDSGISTDNTPGVVDKNLQKRPPELKPPDEFLLVIVGDGALQAL
jgi:hypothetical protein